MQNDSLFRLQPPFFVSTSERIRTQSHFDGPYRNQDVLQNFLAISRSDNCRSDVFILYTRLRHSHNG